MFADFAALCFDAVWNVCALQPLVQTRFSPFVFASRSSEDEWLEAYEAGDLDERGDVRREDADRFLTQRQVRCEVSVDSLAASAKGIVLPLCDRIFVVV